MKTLLKHTSQNHKPVDGGLKDSFKANDLLHSKKLSSTTYQDLMNIKETRKEKEAERGNLFFAIGLTLSLLLGITAINWKTYDRNQLITLGQVEGDVEELLDIPISSQPPPPPPQKIERFKIEVVDDVEIIEEVEVHLDVELTEDMAVSEVVYDNIPIEPVEEEKADEIFQIVEDQPQFPGGISQFYKYVAESIRYPEMALRLDVTGKVFVRFVVEPDGSLSGVHMVKGIGAGCDEEAVRVIKNSPNWLPGKQRGKPVRVYMTVPINFTMVYE